MKPRVREGAALVWICPLCGNKDCWPVYFDEWRFDDAYGHCNCRMTDCMSEVGMMRPTLISPGRL